MDESAKEEPINIRLKRPKTQRLPELTLRPKTYQRDIFLKCLEQNTIVYLGTGLGKTFIVVMYIQDPRTDEQIQSNRKVVFMAPTQDLIKQQAEYINKQVCYTCKVYCGQTSHCGEHIDHWDRIIWEKELKTVDILFMTPQIFASAISTNTLDWSQFSALIFDECHHSYSSRNQSSGHPYSQILAHYREYFSLHTCKQKPRLIGLTASLINNMPKNREGIRIQIHQLERIFSAKCVTDLEVQESKPRVIVNCYDSLRLTPDNDLLYALLFDFGRLIDEALKSKKAEKMMFRKERNLSPEQMRTLSFHKKLRLASLGFSIKPQSFSKVLLGLSRIRNTCGLWILSSICKKLVDVLEKSTQYAMLNINVRPIYTDFVGFLRKVYLAIESYSEKFEHKGLLEHTRAKPKSLLEIIRKEYERSKLDTATTFSCIVFVQSRLEVVALCDWIKQVSATFPDQYGFIKCDYAVGIAAAHTSKYSCITKRKPAIQAKMLRDFREKILNVIVTTSVLEEGIDLPICSSVIRYDEVKNFRQHVQSRGRARQLRSYFILMCEGENYPKTVEELAKYNDFEVTVREDLSGNDVRPASLGSIRSPDRIAYRVDDDEDFFMTADKAVRITSTTAKTILAMYLNNQSRNTPFTEGVQYERSYLPGNLYQTKLYLPSGCPFNDGITGGIKHDPVAADNSAIVAAIKALHEAKELDEYGVPVRRTIENIDKFLAGSNLEPKLEELDKSLEGTIIETDGREYSYFEPFNQMRREAVYMSKDSENRKYKLLKISYVPDEEESRQETRYLFERSVFGIIVDSATSNDFIPEVLFSHYGKIHVKVQVLSSNLKITRREEHSEYLNYTHKLLLKCLAFRRAARIDISEFKFYCLFYLVPLNANNQPDVAKMRASFGGTRKTARFQPGDVVKLNGHYSRQAFRGDENDRLMIVKRVRSDINIDSNTGRNSTYRQEAERKYSCFISAPNQPMIEVMPLSKDFAKLTIGAKSKKEYSTQSLIYIEQFLEFFDADASCVIQAFNKPAIIYRLYVYATATQLDNEFIKATQSYRRKVIELEPQSALEEFNIGAVAANISLSGDQLNNQPDDSENSAQKETETDDDDGDEEEDNEAEDEDEEEEEEFNDDDDDEDYDDDSSDSDGDFRDKKDLEEMLKKQVMNLNDDDDGLERKWDLSEYREPNIQPVTTEKRYYSNPHVTLEYNAQTSPIFERLNLETAIDRINLISKLGDFELKANNDLDLDESLALQNRNPKVDKSITSSIKFDRVAPFKESSRSKSMVEALTLSRAQESFNLEGLENIGDSFLKYIVSSLLYMNTEGSEGFLTSARMRLICNDHFTYLAKKAKLGSYALTRSFDKGQLACMLGSAREAANKTELAEKYHTRMRSKNLADLVESIIGSRLLYHGQFEALLAIKALGLDWFNDKTFENFNENAVVFSRAPTALLDSINEVFKNDLKSVKKKLGRFEEVLGYKFKDITFLVQALTHPSALVKFTRSYERLEFFGDAILDYLVTIHLVTSGSKALREDPGQITSSRSALVNNCSFAKLAIKYAYDLFILHCNHDLYAQLNRVRMDVEEDPEMCFIDMVELDGVVKLLGDVFESVAAAIYLDSGNSLDTLWSVYYPMMKDSIETEIAHPTKNLMVSLFETFPGPQRVSFENVTEHTSEGNVIRTTCFITGYKSFEGRGNTARQAKMRAAQAALASLPSKETLEKLTQEHITKFGDGTAQRARATGRGRGRGGRSGAGRGGGRGRGRGGNRGFQRGAGQRGGYSSRDSSADRNWRNDRGGGAAAAAGSSRGGSGGAYDRPTGGVGRSGYRN